MVTVPDKRGRFGLYGGRYVPETLMPALLELEREYAKAAKDRRFQAEFVDYLKQYVGRPTPLYFAERLTKKLGGPRSISSAKISAIRALTRSTTQSAKHSSQSA